MKLNGKGNSKARSLVRSGDVTKSSAWTPPSAGSENAYIEKNGWGEFGKWFLGVEPSAADETKEKYHYIFTSDFKNVDRAGIVAIRQRAGQQKATDVFNAAGKILEMIDKKAKANLNLIKTKGSTVFEIEI